MTPEEANTSERRYLALDHQQGYHGVKPRENCPVCEDASIEASAEDDCIEAGLRSCDGCGVSNLYRPDGSMVEPVNACECGDDCREINFEWHTTRRGTYGLSHVVTARPAGPALSTWIWLTDSGDAGQSGSKPMAMTEAYVSMVRAQNGRPAFPWIEE